MDSPELKSSDLLPQVYHELRALARARLADRGYSIQPTQLVHDAYLKLANPDWTWVNRAHFFAAAAEAIRRVILDHARARGAQKRGANARRVTLSDLESEDSGLDVDLVALDKAITDLEALDKSMASVVKLRFFCGLSVAETAKVIEVSPRQAARLWDSARTWLFHQLDQSTRS